MNCEAMSTSASENPVEIRRKTGRRYGEKDREAGKKKILAKILRIVKLRQGEKYRKI